MGGIWKDISLTAREFALRKTIARIKKSTFFTKNGNFLAFLGKKCKKIQFFEHFPSQIDDWRSLEAIFGISVSRAFKKCRDVSGVRRFGAKKFFGLGDQGLKNQEYFLILKLIEKMAKW